MAKSKSGGTRSYIRGKIGADVYSIGKDGKGAKQQVVRSLAEVVSNPQTQAQMKGRMIMSTVMQAVSALSPIIDHSFDGKPVGQPNISEFIARNYQLVKADVQRNPSYGQSFNLNKYQEKGAQSGCYCISNGKVIIPVDFSLVASSTGTDFRLPATVNVTTYGGLLEALGLNQGDMLSLISIDNNGQLAYARLTVKEGLTLTTVVTAANIDDMFDIEATANVTFTAGSTWVTCNLAGNHIAAGIIYSKKVGSAWEHSQSFMTGGSGENRAADQVLPTYPTGQERFLNGGDI